MIRPIGFLALMALFLVELMKSALRVARLVLSPRLSEHLSPGMIDYPLTVKTDFEITLLANLITLTPGTLSVDVSADRTILRIHALEARDPEAVIRAIREGFETRVERAFR